MKINSRHLQAGKELENKSGGRGETNWVQKNEGND